MRKEEGNVTLFSIVVIGTLVMLAGISYDLKASEMQRVKIQNVADRAVLAAADLDQQRLPAEVVRDYFTKAGIPHLANEITVTEGLNFRTVSVNSSGTYTPFFMQRFLGINSLPIRSLAEAEERINNVEISMVLDISGSMSWNNKMANLRNAANTFVDTVINDSTEDLVSISIVPYAEHVSSGEAIMDELNVSQRHNFSHCIEFDEADFGVTTLAVNANGMPKRYEQAQHFFWGNTNSNDRSNPVCRFGNQDDIEAFSQNTVALKNKIGRLQPNGNTSIFLGMKWAAGLLDPSFQPVNARLAQRNVTDPVFADRPAAFTDRETLKTVILMTDGQNTSSKRINPLVYQNASHYAHWNSNSFDWWVNRNVNWNERNLWSMPKYWPDYGDSLLNTICTAAKEKNIVIWSIGFEVTDYSAGVMRNCASSPSHFFRVEGVEITEAFSAIARQINQLRLTQ